MASIIRGVLTELGCTGPGIAIHDPEVDMMFETYQLPRSRYFVIERDGIIAGCSGIAPLKGGDADICELQKLYLLPEYRGFGYGKKLVDASLEAAKTYNFKRCYIETLPPMNAAVALYERLGFKLIKKSLGNTGHFACDRWYIKEL